MNINLMEVEDLRDLMELYKELSTREAYFGKMRENFLEMKKNPDYIVLGAKINGELVGSLMAIICHDILGLCKPFMVIEHVIVSSKYRRNSVGRKLMEFIEQIARKRDCYYIMFVSGGARTEAHRFYESLGYGIEDVRGFKKRLV